MRRLFLVLLGWVFPLHPPHAGEAQEGPLLRVWAEPATGAGFVRVGPLLRDRHLLEAVHSGLPLRVRIQVQLWRDGFFDAEVGRHEWRLSLFFDPLTRRYRLEDSGRGGEGFEASNLDEIRLGLEGERAVPLLPRDKGRYYYLATLEAETLSLNDLQELQRWLKGDLAPAVAGEEGVGGALARGLNRLLLRALSLPERRVQVRSPTFSFPPS